MTTTTTKRTAKRPAATRKVGAGRRTLLPVMRPAQNMREIIKQLIMLEDHLFQKCKRCPDCIRKHFLTVEGLAEECGTLCGPSNAKIATDASTLAEDIRTLHHAWEQAPGNCAVASTVASRVRQIRKPLMASYASLPLESLPSKETARVRDVLRSAKKKIRS